MPSFSSKPLTKLSVRNILKRINKQRSISIAATLISLSYLLSRMLGLVRDRLLASNFGLSAQTDAYSAAFRIPDLLFTLLVSGALAVSFIPVFVGYLERKKIEDAWNIASTILNFIIITTLGFGLVAMIWTGPLVKLIAPGFDPERFQLTVDLTRIMLITPLLFGVSSVLGAIQQSFQRFLLFALASVFYNVGIIIGIIFFAPMFNTPIYGVALGVVTGAALQTLMQWFGLRGLDFRYRFRLNLRDPAVFRIIKLMIPRSLDMGLEQINIIVVTAIGSQLAAGSLTSFYFANNLSNVPLGLFGAAIATAIFPSLIRSAKSHDPERLPHSIRQSIKFVLFLVVPAAAVAVIMRGYIVRLLLGFGDQVTADVLGWLSGVIIAQSVFYVAARIFYALEDTRTPLFTSLMTLGLNVFFSFWMAKEFGVPGLAMAISLVTSIELLFLLFMLKRKIGDYGVRAIAWLAAKVFFAAAVMSGVMYGLITVFFPLYRDERGWRVLGPKFLIVCIVGGLIYFAICWILRVEETRAVWRLTESKYLNKLRKKVWGRG